MIRFSKTQTPAPEKQTAGALLAIALQEILPGSHVVRAGGSEVGFYCDCVPAQPLQEFVLRMIEERMMGLVKDGKPVKSREMLPSNAADYFSHHNRPWQAEIARWSEGLASLVDIDGVWLLGDQEQVSSTDAVGAIKLIRFEPITASLPEQEVEAFRIIGIQADNKKDLKQLVKRRKEAEKADHRLLGEKMELFSHKKDLGEGTWLFQPKGEALRRELICWEQEQLSTWGGEWVKTPQLCKDGKSTYKRETTAPHTEEQGVSYYFSGSPLHARLFGFRPRHYCELPLNYLEQRTVFASCSNQEYCGLYRAREQTIHVGTQFSLEDSFDSLLQSIDRTLTILGIPFRWDKTKDLAQVMWQDRLGREWAGGFVSRDKPDETLRVLGGDGKHYPPQILTYSLLGSVERALALWLEYCEGVLPLWGAPEQIRLVPKESSHFERCLAFKEVLGRSGLRCGIDWGREKLAERLGKALDQRVPRIVVVGSDKLTLRSIEGSETKGLTEDEIVELLRNEVNKTRGRP